MIENWLIEKDKLVLFVTSGFVVYINKNGEVHQGIINYFINDTPIWSRHSP